jgi:DHA1 family inner membrane transport protein
VVTTNNLLNVTSSGMLGPLLVLIARDFGTTVGQVGQVAAATYLTWASIALVSGFIADRFGRRPLLVANSTGMALFNAFCAMAPGFGFLLVGRLLTGLASGMGPVAVMATLGDQFPPQRRGMAFGLLNATFGAAALVTVPTLAAVGGVFGWRVPFVIVAVACALMVLPLWLVLPTGRPSTRQVGVWNAYRVAASAPNAGRLLLANMLERMFFAVMTIYLAAFLVEVHGLTTVQAAPWLSLVGGIMLAGNVAGGWLADRLDRARLFVLCQALAGLLVILLFTGLGGLAGSIVLACLVTLSNACGRPGFLAMATSASEKQRGTMVGLVSGTTNIGWALGGALGGLAIGLGSYTGLGWTALAVGVMSAVFAPRSDGRSDGLGGRGISS